jgi:N,N-dimethylformamidase
MNGTSGDELDRCDFSLGSPPNTAVLATSGRHSDYYQLAVEDVLMLGPGLGGSECVDVRSDMVMVEQSSGGAVFSVGSICFTGALSWNGYANNVSRLVHNVLANFISRNSKRC